MTDAHNQAFFGQKVAVIVETNKKEEPFIFIRCIKNKGIKDWERPSQNEGKTVKISLEEIISILLVLTGKSQEWKATHGFKNGKTEISLKRDDEKEIIWFTVDDYKKPIKTPQTELLNKLLKHILTEKIKHATIYTPQGEPNIKETVEEPKPVVKEEKPKKEISKESNVFEGKRSSKDKDKSKNYMDFIGIVKKTTAKAVLLKNKEGIEAWIPKQFVQSGDNIKQNEALEQDVIVEEWILKDKGLV